jgi:hypothetical protein
MSTGTTEEVPLKVESTEEVLSTDSSCSLIHTDKHPVSIKNKETFLSDNTDSYNDYIDKLYDYGLHKVFVKPFTRDNRNDHDPNKVVLVSSNNSRVVLLAVLSIRARAITYFVITKNDGNQGFFIPSIRGIMTFVREKYRFDRLYIHKNFCSAENDVIIEIFHRMGFENVRSTDYLLINFTCN